MKRNRKNTKIGLVDLIVIIQFILVIICIAIVIYAFVAYGNKPIDEVPAWVIWIMMNRGRR